MSTHPLRQRATMRFLPWLHNDLATKSMLLTLFSGTLALGADLTPPEVPNPYNTSEGRAIRDHLEETYRLKVSDKLSLDELRDLYRKTWNTDQEQRFLAGDSARPADAEWVKAHLDEEEKAQRAKWVATLERLGVSAPNDATIEQLRALAAKVAREQEEAVENKRREETERLRAEAAKQNAAAAAADAEKPKAAGPNARGSILLTPVFGEQDVLTEARIRGAVNVFTTKPNVTERDRKEIERTADGLIDTRQRFIKNLKAVAVATNNAGIEVWLGTKPSLSDKERGYIYLLIVNMTPDERYMNSYEVIFTGSKRNSTLTSERGMDALVFPLSIREYHVGEYLIDEGQTMKVESVSFR